MTFTNEHYDPRKILFFNLDLIHDMNGVVQKWHQPEKQGIVLRPEEEYEGGMLLPVAIYPAADGKTVRCQYTCLNNSKMYPELKEENALHVNGLAESEDGIHWQRKHIGEVSFRGSTDNNILPNNPDVEFKIIMDPHDPDPNRRYKGISLQWPSGNTAIETGRNDRAFYSYTSPDGIHWSKPTHLAGSEETGDTSGLAYDERNRCYVFTTRQRGYWVSDAYPKFTSRPIKKGMPDGRWVSISTSTNFETWSPLDLIMERDPADEQGVDFYCGLPFPYGNMYAGWLRRHHFWHGTMDTEFVWSRDRVRWKRSWYRKAFLEPGELGSEDWCFGDVINAKPIRHGDTLYIYYEGRNHVHGPHAIRQVRRGRGVLGMDAYMGVATMRVDGFVSLEAGAMGGEFITELLPGNSEILINARTVGDGVIAIDLLDEGNSPLSDDEILFKGDDCNRLLDLKSICGGKPISESRIRLRVYLENAAIYSVTVNPHMK